MPKLLILPGNSAIRRNPANHLDFPEYDQQEIVPGVLEALDFHKQLGYAIAICENAGGIAQGITSFEEKLSELLQLMMMVPQVDHLIFCPDYNGAFAYLLSRSIPGELPNLRRLRCKRGVPHGATIEAPGDEDALWEDVDGPPFRKPNPGMPQWFIDKLRPQHTIVVWERPEDKNIAQPLETVVTGCGGTLDLVAAHTWRACANPNTGNASSGQAIRRFEYHDPLLNSHKFWTISLQPGGQSFSINYGRIGQFGRKTPVEKQFSSATECRTDYDRRIADQLKQGYFEVNP